jgi:hypothetical protein
VNRGAQRAPLSADTPASNDRTAGQVRGLGHLVLYVADLGRSLEFTGISSIPL